MSDPAKKYSEAYFQQKIQAYQSPLIPHLPSIDPTVQKSFQTACQSFHDSKDALNKAKTLLEHLKTIHAQDDIIQQAQEMVDATQGVLDGVVKSCCQTAQIIWEKLQDRTTTIDPTILLPCTILIQATPKGLAEFCEHDVTTHGPLVDAFLTNVPQMKNMILNGGASDGRYGDSLVIYDKLQSQMAKDASNIMQKLALATALELATPIEHSHDDKKGFVDPIARFWHYVHAYERGELDDAFEHFTPWELRMVINCDSYDDELQWGRDFLKAYRPDEVLWKDEHWRYAWSVRSDLGYRQPDHPIVDYASMLSAGGECGPRAFFGRFICKAFGIPTWGVRQPGHAAMSRWTSSGWTICLGAGFEWSSWTDNRYLGPNKHGSRSGMDFLQETQARKALDEETYFKELVLLECVAEIQGETVQEEVNPKMIWRSISLMKRKALADSIVGSQNLSVLEHDSEDDLSVESHPSCKFSQILPNWSAGCIIIPATSFVSPPKPSNNVNIIPSFLGGGEQLHLENDGTVKYVLPHVIPSASFWLTCRLVNVHERQTPLLLSIELHDDEDDLPIVSLYSIKIDYTRGAWQTTPPVKVQVGPDSTLTFSREPPCHGLSIKDFTLEEC